jgi:hypothetical protein
LTADVRRMIEALPDNLLGRRDRALLLLGFAGGFRRSELAALEVADVLTNDDGLVVKLLRSKTDPEGKGRDVGIPYGSNPSTCPVRARQAWKKAAGISEGALFRGIDRHGHLGKTLHKDSIGWIVKRAAEAAGLDPALYAGHSLRAGLATQSYLNGAGELAIMRQTGAAARSAWSPATSCISRQSGGEVGGCSSPPQRPDVLTVRLGRVVEMTMADPSYQSAPLERESRPAFWSDDASYSSSTIFRQFEFSAGPASCFSLPRACTTCPGPAFLPLRQLPAVLFPTVSRLLWPPGAFSPSLCRPARSRAPPRRPPLSRVWLRP